MQLPNTEMFRDLVTSWKNVATLQWNSPIESCLIITLLPYKHGLIHRMGRSKLKRRDASCLLILW